jgi:uncharacterized membrane protein
MRDDFHGDDPRTVWQNQPREEKQMTLVMIRQMARKHQEKTRWQLFGNSALAVVIVVVCGYGIVRTHALAPRLAFAVALAWTLIGQYFFHRGIWSATLPADAGVSSSIEVYRREIRRRQLLFTRVMHWFFGPLVLAIGTFVWVMAGIAKSQNRSLTAAIPFCTLFAIWIVAFFVQRSRGQKELQRETEELNKVDRESCDKISRINNGL